MAVCTYPGATDSTGGVASISSTTTVGDSTTSSATNNSSTSSMDTGASADPGSTGDPNGLPDGSECTDSALCMSGKCFLLPLPGIDLPSGLCGICNNDQDCVDADLGISCSLDIADNAVICTDGSLGDLCETQASCKDGLFCEPWIDGADTLPKSCSACSDDDDCGGSARCISMLDIPNLAGRKYCAAPASVANDGLCPDVDGGTTCMSGICEPVDVDGLLLHICGECLTDADCGGGTCLHGKWAGGPVGSTCV